MTAQNEFINKIRDAARAAAEDFVQKITEAHTNPDALTTHDLALALLDASDQQGWDRLTWTDDADEYQASYGHDADGNDIDPVPPESALDFAAELLRNFVIVKRPQ